MWLLFSILASISFGLRGIFYHWTSQQPLSRNALLSGTFFMGAVISGACALLLGQSWNASAWIGVQMGLFSFVANASMFQGFKVGKASVVAIITALPAVLVVIGALVIWGETLDTAQSAAFLVIIAGVLLVRYSNDITLGNLQGAQWGLLALAMFAANDLSGKWSQLLEAPLFPTLFLMFFTGTFCFGAWRWIERRQARLPRKEAAVAGYGAGSDRPASDSRGGERSIGVNGTGAAVKSWSDRRAFLVGMLIGITNAVGMVLILTAFDLGKAGLVSAVVASNVLFVLAYTRFYVRERFTRLETAGVVTTFGGILMLKLLGG
ncbi:DMT family transporter [Paenibacillus methanolicus]|uniref:EamA-like transporter family protein n=1 Tax=Paenibacillus methanolicus TaxID=582686 RepID=A0A5S5C6P8_9BACL|nr:DMT family transporter [Paenibacillus methanolicus]TYP74010.1 EamA-like transporter family protein [Paenibacillus methanolicus]